jgi:hypothetical protein
VSEPHLTGPLGGSLSRLGAGILLLGAAACASGGRALPPDLPLNPQALAARRPPLGSFRAELAGRVRSDGKKGRFKAGLGAIPPDFRLDVFHPVSGSTLMSMGVQGDRLHVVWPAEGDCLQSSSSAEVMAELLGVPVPPEQFLHLLSAHLYQDGDVEFLSIRHPPMAVAVEGAPPPGAGDRLIITAVEPDTGVRFEGELLAERQGRALRGRREDPAGNLVLLDYPVWREQGADGQPAFPGRVEVKVPARNLRLEVEIRGLVAGGPAPEHMLPVLPDGCRLVTIKTLPRALPLGAALDDAGD